MRRRKFIKSTSGAAFSFAALSCLPAKAHSASRSATEPFFELSLAEWSLHRTLFAKKMTNMDFAAKAKNDFGIENIEYVNQFFKDKAKDKQYLTELNQRATDLGVKQLIIMIDGEGGLGDVNAKKRQVAVENHYKWVEAAKFLGCHSIRVNAYGVGEADAVADAAVKGLGALSAFAKDFAINVIVENHGGYSSNGKWLSGVMEQVNMDNCGTLPDFGNFCIERKGGDCLEEYDRYQGVTELMPFAKAVSAKTHDFNDQGEEVHTDFLKMMKIVRDAGYIGFVGIEYEGQKLSEDEGILASKRLLDKVATML